MLPDVKVKLSEMLREPMTTEQLRICTQNLAERVEALLEIVSLQKKRGHARESCALFSEERMADISKCSGTFDAGTEGEWHCALAVLCYRYTAPSSEMQSWIEPQYKHDSDPAKRKCVMFYERK